MMHMALSTPPSTIKTMETAGGLLGALETTRPPSNAKSKPKSKVAALLKIMTDRQQPCENLASIDPNEERRVMAIKLPRLVLGGCDDPEGWTFVLEVMITNYCVSR